MTKMRGKFRSGCAAALLASTAALIAGPAQAQQVAVNVPAQSAADAITSLAQQTGTQILFDHAQLSKVKSNPVRGKLSVKDALAAILKGSKFEAATSESGALIVRPIGAAAVAAAGSDTSPEVPSDQEGIAEILVVGSRSLNADIRRTEDDVQPYVVFKADEIKSSGVSTVEEFLRQRMPMDSTKVTGTAAPIHYNGARSEFNLRGLGSDQTLILVNGRRMPSVSGTEINFKQPDINGIPVGSIERIEVLPATASGIYGGGATGGVINVILKQDYHGIQIDASYGNSFKMDVPERRLDISGGLNFNGGRTQLTFGASMSDTGRLYGSERDFQEKGIARQLRNNPAALFSNPFLGRTGNVMSLLGNLVLDNGLEIGSTITSIPSGYTGISEDGGAGLVANAGTYNFEPSSNSAGTTTLHSGPSSRSLNLTLNHRFSDSLRAFADFSLFRNKSTATVNLGTNPIFMFPDDPGNPFQNFILYSVNFPGLNADFKNLSEILRGNFGLIYRRGSWSAQLEKNISRARTTYRANNRIDMPALLSGITSGQLNAFRDLNVDDLDYSPYFLDPQIQNPNDTILNETALRIGGPVIRLPAGHIQATGLLSHRTEKAPKASTVSGDFEVFLGPRSNRVLSAYGELRIPIFGTNFTAPLMRSLEAQLSIRHDNYKLEAPDPADGVAVPVGEDPVFPRQFTLNFASTNYTVGLRYEPVDGLVLRGSHGTGFLPPSMSEIASNTYEDYVLFDRDPLRSNAYGFIFLDRWTSGGRTDIRPERSKSTSFGLILNPGFLPGLRISADYVRIAKRDEIAAIGLPELIELEALFPGRVVRGPNLPSDPEGWAGPIIELDSTVVNLFKSKVEALDLSADYRWSMPRFGEFKLSAVFTRNIDFRRQVAATTDPVNMVGYSDGPSKWVGSVGLDWTKGPLSLNWFAQYRSSNWIYYATADESEIETYILNQGSERMPATTVHNVGARYRFDSQKGPLKGMELRLTISNLFNKAPPTLAWAIDPRGIGYGVDPRLRRFVFGVRKAF